MAEAFITFSPSPAVRFRLPNQDQHDLMLVFLDPSPKVTLQTFSPVDWLIDIDGDVAIVIPKVHHLVTPQVDQIRFLKFVLPNFPSCQGTLIQRDGEQDIGRIELQDDKWRFIIDPTRRIKKNVETLSRHGGYAITHVGRLERIDGSVFNSSDGETALSDLSHFLAFVRGAWSSPFLAVGYDVNGGEVWKEWSLRPISSKIAQGNWFDPGIAHSILPELFPGFMHLLHQEKWREALERIIYWYVHACTKAAGMDGSIVLSQTALELLSWKYVANVNKYVQEKEFGKLAADSQIRLLLSFCDIPREVPPDFSSLGALCANLPQDLRQHLSDGPSIITQMRNSIVHPVHKLQAEIERHPDPIRLYREVLDLSLQYIELVLLRLFGYKGMYILRQRYFWKTLGTVPWAEAGPS